MSFLVIAFGVLLFLGSGYVRSMYRPSGSRLTTLLLVDTLGLMMMLMPSVYVLLKAAA